MHKRESKMDGKNKSEASRSSRSNNSNNTNLENGQSKVVDCGRHKSSCGYCKSLGPTSITHGLWAVSLTVDDYQVDVLAFESLEAKIGRDMNHCPVQF